MYALAVEILSKDGSMWNVLNTRRSLQELEELKKLKGRWYSSIFKDRSLRIMSYTHDKGVVVERVVG